MPLYHTDDYYLLQIKEKNIIDLNQIQTEPNYTHSHTHIRMHIHTQNSLKYICV